MFIYLLWIIYDIFIYYGFIYYYVYLFICFIESSGHFNHQIGVWLPLSVWSLAIKNTTESRLSSMCLSGIKVVTFRKARAKQLLLNFKLPFVLRYSTELAS